MVAALGTTMADPVLHIKDSYYFEVPKLLYAYDYQKRQEFPDVWISLDPDFQKWEAERLYAELQERDAGLPPKETVLRDWEQFVDADHKNFAKPLKVFLDEKHTGHVAKFGEWKQAKAKAAQVKKDAEVEPDALTFEQYLTEAGAAHSPDQAYFPFLRWRQADADVPFMSRLDPNVETFHAAAREARNIDAWKTDAHVAEWDKKKLDDYNAQLSGKILIPQPFATLRNLYEYESGFAISKYLLIEVFVALVLVLLFAQLAQRIKSGKPPKGKFWNLLEVFLLFIRDQIARPVLGSHDQGHDEHAAAEHAHAEHAHAGDGHGDHGHSAKANAHAQPADPATRFLPLLWTIFFFVLGCNLMGMVPWAGAPTAAFAFTAAMACVTFLTVIVAGMMQFGVGGFFLNQIPGMDLPWYMAIIIKPMILLIELLGLGIKHGVLAVRLFANMVAGHLVLLGIMGFAFGAEAALKFTAPDAAGWQWAVMAVIAVVASATFSILELFVAFLQAYIFTFLSALFIGAAIHKH
jgi:F-type H+-transporting ATPase subunit a